MRVPRNALVRSIYDLNALTGQRHESGSSLPPNPDNDGITMGEKAMPPSIAALVLGTRSRAGYKVTEPSVANAMRNKSIAATSDPLRVLAKRTRKKVLKVNLCIEITRRGSHGA